MASNCSGYGECLTQTTNCNTYGQSPDFTCTHNCKPISCCNEIVCGSWLPPWFHGLKKAGICICVNCDVAFGKKLDIVESAECPVCLETKQSVVMPNCTHSVCVDCFKRCMYGEDIPQPPFPYPMNIEDEYFDSGGREDPEWCARYPLVKKWSKDLEKWENEGYEKYKKEASLRMCPYCRR